MFKIVIVDDEAIVRIGLKSCVNWEEYGFEIVGDASNGEEALQLFSRVKPDIVLTDIKMPVMDGIQLIKHLSQNSPEIKVLVLSCFNEYNLVREAMKYGATDYLFKPTMSSEDILAAMIEIREKLIKERIEKNEVTHLKYRVSESLSLLREKYLNELVKRDFDQANIESEFKKLGIELEEKNIICLAIEIDEHKKIIEKYMYDELQIFYTTCRSIVNEATFQTGQGINFMNDFHNIIVFLNIGPYSGRNLHEQIISLSRRIQNMAKMYADVSISIGVSNTISNYSSLKTAYSQASSALSKKFFHGKGKIIIHEENKSDVPNIKDFILEDIEELKQTLKSRNRTDILKSIDQIFMKVNNRNAFQKEDICKLAIDLAVMYLRIYREEIMLEDFFGDNPNMLQEVYESETINEVEKWFQDITVRFISSLEKKYSPAVLKAIDYISDNFTRDIDLQQISTYVNMSKNYFSKVFKDETGENFIGYLSRVRIKHAKKLLEEENLKTYEVSERVGYTNYRYFCRIFKKITGMNPSDVKSGRNSTSID